MRVVLVGAEFEENLAIRYLWGALEAAGHEVRHVVFNAREDLPVAARAIAGSGAALVGLSMVFTTRAREFADLATEVRALGFAGRIVAGGHFAAFHAESILRDVPALDAIACGEGEELIVRLAGGPPSLAEVAGLVYRDADGRIARSAPAPKTADLDTLPVPPRKKPLDAYLGLGITNLLGSRGCLHGCAFCSIVAWHKLAGGPRLRLRAPQAIAAEMADLYRRGARIFNFHDDNFFLPDVEETRTRVRALAGELRRRGVGRIAFAVKARPDEIDEALFAELCEMGLFRVFLGIEAGTADALCRLGRGQKVADNERALAIVARLDLHTCFNLLLWNPASTLEDVAANVAFLRAHPANPMNFCRTEIYAGTPLERSLGSKGRLLGDYWGWDYRIADERAQALFEVVFPAFRERNYGGEGVHHLAMQVDYELQLLGHFFGRRRALVRRAKAHVVRVNENTCRHLEAAIDWAGTAPADAAARAHFAEALGRRVRADDRRLREAARALLAEIRSAALAPRTMRLSPWRRAAAAAGVAAALAACADDTHPTEMAPVPPLVAPGPPPPPRPAADAGTPVALDAATPVAPDAAVGPGTHMFEMVALPPPAPPAPPPLGAPAAIREELLRLARPVLGARIPRGGTRLELWIDAQGHVTQANVLQPDLHPEGRASLEGELRALTFTTPGVAGHRFVVTLSGRDLHPAVRPQPIPTHPSEMAPEPSHPSEMIAEPPQRKK